MHYVERPPSAALAPFIHRVWWLDVGSRPEPDSILPDGRAELIFHLTGEVREPGLPAQPPSLFAGQLTRALTLEPAPGTTMVGVSFHSAGARAFFAVPQASLRDARVAVDTLAPPLGEAFRRQLLEQSERGAVFDRLERELPQHLRLPLADPWIDAVVDTMRRSRGELSVVELARSAHRVPRQVERAFHRSVGLTPKELARIVRVQRAIELAKREPRGSLAAIAAECGYYDQSHLARDFRNMAGCPPSAWVGSARPLADLFLESEPEPPPTKGPRKN